MILVAWVLASVRGHLVVLWTRGRVIASLITPLLLRLTVWRPLGAALVFPAGYGVPVGVMGGGLVHEPLSR